MRLEPVHTLLSTLRQSEHDVRQDVAADRAVVSGDRDRGIDA